MYHSVSEHLDDHLHPYYRTVTTPERFEQQMCFLSQSGYEVLTLSEAVRLLQEMSLSNKSSQEKSTSVKSFNYQRPVAVITFDDGLRDFYTTAFPILEKFAFKATVFLTSGLINKTFLTGYECLKVQEIKELVKSNVEFGSHTVNHPQLKKLSKDEIVYELIKSKQMIEEIIGYPVSLFSYPYRFPEENAAFTKMFGMILSDHGYTAGVTTSIGLSTVDDIPLFLRRLPVNDCDDLQFFRAKLAGCYDWLHKGQLTYKRLRAILCNY
ncbi:polysaccharide deacetylase family protein [Methylomicrobium lacus]|uniref:polysaccharide deacetylase family protein n=1 Tax=Methylomicrobium lacus TaxID=136992 RepID=UPI0035A94810